MKKLILSILGSLFLIIALALFNAYQINPNQIKAKTRIIENEKIDENLDGTILVYFSDLNYNNLINMEYCETLIETINRFDPDIILFGGDLIEDNTVVDIETLTSVLSKLKTDSLKLAVLGDCDNHNPTSLSILQNAGFHILNNESICYYNKTSFLQIVGLNSNDLDSSKAFQNLNTDFYTLVFSHYPDDFAYLSSYSFDRMLAGHSLGCQVYLPLFSMFSKEEGFQQYCHGTYKVDEKILEVSNGIGLKENKVRLNADPNILVYRYDKIRDSAE